MRLFLVAACAALAIAGAAGGAHATEYSFTYLDTAGDSAEGTLDVVNGIAVSGSGTLTMPDDVYNEANGNQPASFIDVPIYLIPLTSLANCNSATDPTSCTPRTGDGTDLIGVDNAVDPLTEGGPFFSVGVTPADYQNAQGIGWNPYAWDGSDTYFLSGVGTIDDTLVEVYQGGPEGAFILSALADAGGDPINTPEPASLTLLALGAGALVAVRLRRTKGCAVRTRG